ncbi:MAG: YgfZ/GcvT domain-containing protein [Acidimicrobiales bacterium]
MGAFEPVASGYAALTKEMAAHHLARQVLLVSGRDALSYLEGQCSQELGGLEVGMSSETLVLEPDGKLVAFARVSRLGEEELCVDVEAPSAPSLLARLERFKLRSRLAIEPADWVAIALRGPLTPPASDLSAPLVALVEHNGRRGADLLGPRETLEPPAGVPWCTDDAWEAARIEAGEPLMGKDLSEGMNPFATGIIGRAVSFTKGCYTGQELVARIDSRGGHVPRRLIGLVLAADPDPGALAGSSLFDRASSKAVGEVTSAAWCPGLGGVGALGYLHRSVGTGAVVRVGDDRGAGSITAETKELPLL